MELGCFILLLVASSALAASTPMKMEGRNDDHSALFPASPMLHPAGISKRSFQTIYENQPYNQDVPIIPSTHWSKISSPAELLVEPYPPSFDANPSSSDVAANPHFLSAAPAASGLDSRKPITYLPLSYGSPHPALRARNNFPPQPHKVSRQPSSVLLPKTDSHTTQQLPIAANQVPKCKTTATGDYHGPLHKFFGLCPKPAKHCVNTLEEPKLTPCLNVNCIREYDHKGSCQEEKKKKKKKKKGLLANFLSCVASKGKEEAGVAYNHHQC